MGQRLQNGGGQIVSKRLRKINCIFSRKFPYSNNEDKHINSNPDFSLILKRHKWCHIQASNYIIRRKYRLIGSRGL